MPKLEVDIFDNALPQLQKFKKSI